MITLTLALGKKENKQPAGKIILNQEIMHDGPYTKTDYDLKPLIGKNILQVSLENKTDRDTTLKGNEVVSDIFVIIKDIKCKVTNDTAGNLDSIGNYLTDKNEDLKTYGYLSYNGVYTFEFEYPFFIFDKNKKFYQ
jgi:hypothetical protein